MPVCDLHIISYAPGVQASAFLSTLRKHSITPIIKSRPLRWVILPEVQSTVPLLALNTHWDLLLILPGGTEFPSEVKSKMAAEWQVAAGVPSRLLKDFPQMNAKLLNPPPGTVKPVDNSNKRKAESSQSLELSPELERWIATLPQQYKTHPISMLNLLAFNPGKKPQYIKYGQAFAAKVGSRHGGVAKVVGNVASGQGKDEGWDEIALAHYPSLQHFAAMIGSQDYQDVNKEYRLGALKDTCILCTMEIGDDGELAGGKSGARL